MATTVQGAKTPIMSTSAPLYSTTSATRESRATTARQNRENRSLKTAEDEELEDIIEQIKMACRPAEEEGKKKEETDSDYDTDIDDQEPSRTPFDQYGRRTYRRTCRKLGVTPISAVAKDLDTNTLCVCHRGLSEHEVLAIANALLDNTSVVSIKLEGNRLTQKGCQYICLALAENLNVTTLCLRSNGLCGKCAEYLADLMDENSTIKSLDVSENNFLDVDAFHFQRILLESRFIQELNLSHNNLGDDAAKLLGPAIGKNDFLKVLDLSWNVVRPAGAAHLCKGLEENVSLHTVLLGYNGLSNSGALALASVLRVNATLLELDVTCNRIYDQGAFLMAKAMEHNETLKVLKASQNPVTDLGALALVTAVQINLHSAVCLIDLSSVHVYHDTVSVARELNQRRNGFCFLHGQVMDEMLQVKQATSDSEDSPLLLLQWYMDLKSINLLTAFKDVEHNGIVSREQFRAGLKEMKAPLSDIQIIQLMNLIADTGEENTVHLQAIINAPRKKEKTVMPK